MIKFFLLCGVLSISLCFADRSIQPVQLEGQEKLLDRGHAILVSSKVHRICIRPQTEVLRKQSGLFSFSFLNNSDDNINFFFSNLRIYDQQGRQIKVVSKDELAYRAKRKKDQEKGFVFLSAFADGVGRILDSYPSTSETRTLQRIDSRVSDREMRESLKDIMDPKIRTGL